MIISGLPNVNPSHVIVRAHGYEKKDSKTIEIEQHCEDSLNLSMIGRGVR